MKILFLHSNLDVGGAEVMRLTLLRNLDRKKYNIKVYCIGEKGAIGREIEGLGYEVDELKKDPSSLNIGISFIVAKYLKKERPDILHSSLFNANFHARIAGGLLQRVPHIITEEHGEHKQYKGIKFLPYRLTDFFLSGLNDFIVCCSSELKEDIVKKERLSCRKVVHIENCLDLSRYGVRIERENIKKRHNITNELILITTASLKAGKGHDYLIEVIREIKDAGYSFKCFFAGDGPLRKDLEEKCRKLGLSEEVIFLGNVENIADYLNASDIFMLPSFSEGLSIALMEAMLMKLACIVTDVGSNAGLIRTGFNGTVVSPGDKKGLKDAIIFYFKNPGSINEFGKRSEDIIKTRYSSTDVYTRRYYELWDKGFNNKR